MLNRFRVVIIALLILLSACTARPAVLPASQPQAPSPASTAAAPPTQMISPSSTAVLPQNIEPPAPPEQPIVTYPVPKPLTGQAPWLVFPCASEGNSSLPIVAGSDGRGCVAFTLPGGVPGRAWISIISPNSSYAAFRVKLSGSPAAPDGLYRLQPNGLDDQLWIIKLPENRIVRKIAQIDKDAWEQIGLQWQNASADSTSVPLPLAVILDPAGYNWSPDGRFLAYSGVTAEGVDLYVYDTSNDSIRRMSRGRQGAFFWSWSPDGKWIVYHNMAGCVLSDGTCHLERGFHYYAISFPGREIQFENSFPAGDIDWISKTKYILQDVPAPGQPYNRLAQVDLANASVTNLYDEPFLSFTYVPKTYESRKEMYLLNLPADPANDRVTGVYTLYPPREVDWLRPFLTGTYGDYTIQWERKLEQFVLSRDVTKDISTSLSGNELIQKDVVLIPAVLANPVSLGVLSTARLDVSPDSAWFTTRLSSENWALYTKQGKPVLELGLGVPGKANPVQWLKDSSAFFFFGTRKDCASSFGCVYRFDKAQEWKAVKIAELKGSPDVLQVIAP